MGFPVMPAGMVSLFMFRSYFTLAPLKSFVGSLLHFFGLKQNQAQLIDWHDLLRENDSLNMGLDYDETSKSFPEEIRESLASVPVESLKGQWENEEDAQCAVCLCEFGDQDVVWQLPNCSHVFHKLCLGRWLDHQQTTCPTCRASLLTKELLQKHKKKEEQLLAELAMWFSSHHRMELFQSPWYHRHGFVHGMH